MSNFLRSRDNIDVNDAVTEFGADHSLLVVRPRGNLGPYFYVPEGCYSIVTQHGREIRQGGKSGSKVWKPGFYFGSCFRRVSHLVTMHSVIFRAPVKGCKTKDNVNVTIDASIVFRIDCDPKGDHISRFVHEVTPEGLSAQLRDAVEEALRIVARKLRHDQVFGLRSKLSKEEGSMLKDRLKGGNTLKTLPEEDLLNDADVAGDGIEMGGMEEKGDDSDEEEDETLIGDHDEKEESSAMSSMLKGSSVCEWMQRSLNKQFLEQGVRIEDVIITDVQLPTNIRTQMARKTMVISENALQKMTQANDMLTLMQREEIAQLNQAHSEERLAELQYGSKAETLGNLELKEMTTAMRWQELAVKAASKVVVDRIQIEGQEKVTEINLELEEAVSITNIETNEEVIRTKAEMLQYSGEKRAEAKMEAAQKVSAANQVLTAAEGKAAPLLNGLKTYQTQKKHLKVYDSLSTNPDLVVSGNHGKDVNTMILCDAILDRAEGTINRKQMLSELLVLRDGSNIMLQPNF